MTSLPAPQSDVTPILPTDEPASLHAAIDEAVKLLRAGDIVALPTETVYGLAADALNAEWAGTGVRVYALVDYYQKGRIAIRDYLQKTFGWDAATVGSHAGTSDTSQLLYVFGDGIRLDRLLPGGGGPDSGVNGDPTKATAAIGKIAVDQKVNFALEQYRMVKGVP